MTLYWHKELDVKKTAGTRPPKTLQSRDDRGALESEDAAEEPASVVTEVSEYTAA